MLDDLLKDASSYPKVTHPKGWQPGVEIVGDEATVVTDPIDDSEALDDPDVDSIIRGFELSPEDWEIVGNVHVRRWQRYDMEWLRYFRVNLKRRDKAQTALADELMARVVKRKPVATRTAAPDSSTLVLCYADFQIGKACEEGGGSRETVAAFERGIDMTLERIKRLRKAGEPIERLAILNVGDTVEGCSQNYPSQSFTVDLNHRDQQRVALGLFDQGVDAFAPIMEEVILAAVPSNHGEIRKDGKAYTTLSDNIDMMLMEQLAFAYSKNPDRYGHVKFVIAGDEVSVVFETSNTVIGVTHGHKTRASGSNIEKAFLDWWKAQAFGERPVRDCQVLVSGHFHHFRAVEVSQGRTWFQAPSCDGGSKWFKDIGGADSSRGILTFTVADGNWDNLKVLRV